MKYANVLPFQPFSNSNSKLSTVFNLLLIISNLNGKCGQDYLAQAAVASNTHEHSSLNRQTLTPCLFFRSLTGLFIEPTAGALGPQIMLPHTALLQWADKNKNSLPSKCLSFGKIREKGWTCAKDKEIPVQNRKKTTHTYRFLFSFDKIWYKQEKSEWTASYESLKTQWQHSSETRQEGLHRLKLLVKNVFLLYSPVH